MSTATHDLALIFAGCSPRERRRLARLGTPVIRPAGTILARQGEPGTEFFVVVSGQVRVERDGSAVAELGPGDHAGELALLTGEPRQATLVTDTEVEVLVFDRREFATLLEVAPSLVTRLVTGAIRLLAPAA